MSATNRGAKRTENDFYPTPHRVIDQNAPMRLSSRSRPWPETGRPMYVSVEVLHQGRVVASTTIGPDDDPGKAAERLKKSYRDGYIPPREQRRAR